MQVVFAFFDSSKSVKWQQYKLVEYNCWFLWGCFFSAKDNIPPTDKPTHLDFIKGVHTTPLTPTGYTQPPTPDFPPPSPTTAMMGIELKIQQIVSMSVF